MLERLKFFFNKPKFSYNKETGGGMALEKYNIFTDTVTIRHSLRGYITCRRCYKRAVYLKKIAEWGLL